MLSMIQLHIHFETTIIINLTQFYSDFFTQIIGVGNCIGEPFSLSKDPRTIFFMTYHVLKTM